MFPFVVPPIIFVNISHRRVITVRDSNAKNHLRIEFIVATSTGRKILLRQNFKISSPSLVTKLPLKLTGHFDKYINEQRLLSASLFTGEEEITITTDDVMTEIKYLKYKAPGPDGIPNYPLKQLPSLTTQRITNLYNAAFKHKHFPTNSETGKEPQLPNSYRSISLMNTLSKITENLILLQINKFPDNNDILNPNQYHAAALQNHRFNPNQHP